MIRIFSLGISLLYSGSLCAAEPPVIGAHIKKHFESKDYKATWGKVVDLDPKSTLELGFGNGHGSNLGWVRFQPGKDNVEVMTIDFKPGWKQYKTKWPADEAPVEIKIAWMKSEAYAKLLGDLAIVEAANLQKIDRSSSTTSSNDFWVSSRVTTGTKAVIDRDWAGYQSSSSEIYFAKAKADIALAQESVAKLEFKQHKLTDDERDWASEKFVREFKGKNWWVRERYVIVIGVIGNEKVYPELRKLLGVELKGDSKDTLEYFAINAVTRLTGKDVRDKPVEEMDLEKNRKKVLELIPEKK